MKAEYARRMLDFRFEARTSRSVMTQKETFFLRLTDEATGRSGIGEAALFRGLSADDCPDYEERLSALCRSLNRGESADVSSMSSMVFGLESALLSLQAERPGILFDTPFTRGEQPIEINGLVWMDTIEKMLESADRKIAEGFRCVKIKIGQHDFEKEIELIDRLRVAHGPDELTLRLDANGAYTAEEAVAYLKRLAPLDIHSVEQPVKAGRWDQMAYVCENSPIDIALDEELIGVTDSVAARKMLLYIAPRYIILKPSLCGGFSGAGRWVEQAESLGIGWWVTSALESNVGLDAIAQWTSAMNAEGCQGLGTGSLYHNNFASPLSVGNGKLRFDPRARLNVEDLQWNCPE